MLNMEGVGRDGETVLRSGHAGVEGVCWVQADFPGTCKQNWPLHQVEALYVLPPQFLGRATLVASLMFGKCGWFLIRGACVQGRLILKRKLSNTSLIKGKEVL